MPILPVLWSDHTSYFPHRITCSHTFSQTLLQATPLSGKPFLLCLLGNSHQPLPCLLSPSLTPASLASLLSLNKPNTCPCRGHCPCVPSTWKVPPVCVPWLFSPLSSDSGASSTSPRKKITCSYPAFFIPFTRPYFLHNTHHNLIHPRHCICERPASLFTAALASGPNLASTGIKAHLRFTRCLWQSPRAETDAF